MKSNKLKIIQLFIAVIAVGMVAMSVFTNVDLFSLIMGAGGAVYLMAATGAIVDDTVTKEEVDTGSSTLNDFDYDKMIVQELPSRTPLDTIFRNMARKRKVDSIKVPFFTVDTKPFKDTVKTAKTVGDAQLIDLAVNDIDMWSKHDTVVLNGIAGYDSDNAETTLNNLVARVLSVNTTDETLRLQALNGYTSGAKLVFHDDIAKDTVLTRAGKAEPELAMQTTPYAILPWEEFNYCQNFMAQIEESEWQKLHKQRVVWGFSDYAKLNIADMRATKEMSFLFGARSAIQDAETKEMIYTCGGLTYYITKSNDVGATVSESDFNDWRQELFEDNNGSEKRYAFLGADLWKKIQNIDTVQKQIAANKTEIVWGINFARIEFGNEVIYLHKHRLLSERGWGQYGIILDLEHVYERAFKPLKETTLDLRTSGQKNADAKVIMEVSCPILKYPATHMILKPSA